MPLSPLEVLRKVPLFSGLSEADLAAFAELTRERSYPKGSVIVTSLKARTFALGSMWA